MSWLASSSAEVLRELAGPVDLGGPRRDPLVGELADGVAQEDLLLGQADRAVGSVVGGHAGAMLAAGQGPIVGDDKWRAHA